MLGRNKFISSLLTLLAFTDNIHAAELSERIQKDIAHLLGHQTNPEFIAQTCLIISPACQNEETYTTDFMHAFLNFMIAQAEEAFEQISPEINPNEYAILMWERKIQALAKNAHTDPLNIPAVSFEEGCFGPYLTDAFVHTLQSQEIPPVPVRSKFLSVFSWKEELIQYLDTVEYAVDTAQHFLGKTKWALSIIRASLGLPPAPYYMR